MGHQTRSSRPLDDKLLLKPSHALSRQGNNMPQTCYEWMSIWWRHFAGKKRRLFIVTVEKGDAIESDNP
jgi:hypothetical protein